MDNLTPTWQKELDEKFTLLEYPQEPNRLNCIVAYGDEENDFTFAFGSWGMERESITVEDCVLCCQAMLCYDANVSISSFGANLEYARNEFCEDEDEQQ